MKSASIHPQDNRFDPLNNPAYRKSKHHLHFILVCLILFSSCKSTSKTTIPVNPYQAFYEEYSRKLGFNLTGTENMELLREVTVWLGTPYRFGGKGKKGVDCSGFVSAIYQNVFDYNLPRRSADMARTMAEIQRDILIPGDLVFFGTRRGDINHVGIYLGQGYFIHASTSKGVIVSHLDEPYYKRTYIKGGALREI
jgi:hypothetical protein